MISCWLKQELIIIRYIQENLKYDEPFFDCDSQIIWHTFIVVVNKIIFTKNFLSSTLIKIEAGLQPSEI